MAEVIGLQSLLNDFGELPLSLGRKRLALARTVRIAAKILEKRIEELAPDDPTTPGSQIRENIDINVSDQTAEGAIAYIGPSKKAFIAGFHERGTIHQTAGPFIAPAYEQTINAAIDTLSKELGDFIQGELTK